MFNFENPLNTIRNRVNKTMNESKIPTEDHESTLGVYGGRIKTEEDGKMVWDNRGIISQIDRLGDAVLRTYDDHVVKDLEELFKKHPKAFLIF